MKIIDDKATVYWLSDRGFPNPVGKNLLPGFIGPLSFRIPADSGEKTALSRKLISYLDTDDEMLLWINEWGIWPSSENINLFDGFRRSLGEYSSLKEKPGHIFSRSDIETIESLLSMVLYFFWGAILISSTGNIIVKISHDEIIDIFVKDKKSLSNIQKTFGHQIIRCSQNDIKNRADTKISPYNNEKC